MKTELEQNTEPANSRNTLLCAGRANSEFDSKPETSINFNPKYLLIRSQLNDLESEVNKLIEQFEEQYKLENGSRGVRLLLKTKPETWKKTVEFGVGINKRVLV